MKTPFVVTALVVWLCWLPPQINAQGDTGSALAASLDDLRAGDELEFYGVYEWNAEGGVVHRTHHDPQDHHEGGWLKHLGRVYE